jgi:sarcosine oxidase, subunit delta
MLLIECPWCGPRAETEFSCGGEADIARPLETEKLSDKEWGDYLFMRKNPRGVHREQWNHAQGCRRWFKVQRDTVSYEIQGYETFDRPLAVMSDNGGTSK